MKRFVSKGDKVVVKPNIGWDRRPEQGANTNPLVVAEVVRQCFDAGAADVQVFDYTCNAARRCYKNSGIEKAASEAGAKVSYVIDKFFRDVKIEDPLELKKWPFYKPALDADKYINVPVLKHHGLAAISVGLKNVMGVIGGKRGRIHEGFDRKIVDLNTVIRPDLTIVDATRVLRRNGPTGGSLADVDNVGQIIAGIDPVAVDTAAAKLFGAPIERLNCLAFAEQRGLGSVKAAEAISFIDLGS
jgi:uncharacterized protein (DUF362 family)